GNVWGAAVQPDWKLLVWGVFTQFGGQPRGRIARLLPDGSLESTATFDPGTGADDVVSALVAQPDGKMLLGGHVTQVNGQPRDRIARLWPDGSLEERATFNPGEGANEGVRTFTVQANGHFVVGGVFTQF